MESEQAWIVDVVNSDTPATLCQTAARGIAERLGAVFCDVTDWTGLTATSAVTAERVTVTQTLASSLVRGSEEIGHIRVGFNTVNPPAEVTREFARSARIVESHLKRLRLLEGLKRIDRARLSELRRNLFLDDLLDEIVDDLGMEFAAVWLTTGKRGELRYARGRNVARGWHRMSRYLVGSRNDILLSVLHARKTELIDGWDDRFNEQVYRKFAHNLLTRLWTPILVPNDDEEIVIGVLETGCLRRSKDRQFTLINQERLEAMARQSAWAAWSNSLCHAIDVAAEEIRIAASAESVAITVWQSGDCVLDGWSGTRPLDFDSLLAQERPVFEAVSSREQCQWMEVDSKKVLSRSLPFEAGALGILSIRRLANDDFNPADTEPAEALVDRLNAMIGGDLTRIAVTEERDQAKILVGVRDSAELIKSDPKFEDFLDDLAGRALLLMEADSVCIYGYNADRGNLARLLSKKGEFLDNTEMSDLAIDFVNVVLAGETHRFIPNVSAEPSLIQRRSLNRKRFAERERVVSCAILKLTTGPGSEPVGVMFINYRKDRAFAPAQKGLAKAISASASATISSHRFSERSRKILERSKSELQELGTIDEFIANRVGTLDLKETANRVIDAVVRVLGCKIGGVLQACSTDLKFLATCGFPQPKEALPRDKGIVSLAVNQGTDILIPDVRREPEYVPLSLDMRSELVVPILGPNGETWGAVNLEDDRMAFFSNADLRTVKLFAGRLVFASRINWLHGELQNQILPRVTLGRIAGRIQQEADDLSLSLRLLLVGLTADIGLGFSRAMLFLLDEDEWLRGRVAIGALDEKEAKDTWAAIDKRCADKTPSEKFDIYLAQAEAESKSLHKGPTSFPLCSKIRLLSWPRQEVRGIVSKVLHQCTTTMLPVQNLGADWLGAKFREVGMPDTHQPAWVVALRAGSKTIGVLLVDNLYLPGREQESPADEKVRSLEAFAELAALTVENYRLRTHVQTEVSTKLIHQIPNPIIAARNRLDQTKRAVAAAVGKLDGYGESLQSIRKHMKDIESAADAAQAQLEMALWVTTNSNLFANVLLGKDLTPKLGPGTSAEFIDLMRKVVTTFSGLGLATFHLSIPSDSKMNTLRWDRRLMEQVFYALLDNARHYSTDGAVYVQVDCEQRVFVSISNGAPHMSDEELDQCAQMHGRGKRACAIRPDGSGFGLPLAQAVVKAHKGKWSLSSPGDRFLVEFHLPLS